MEVEEVAKVGVCVFVVNEKNQYLVCLRNVPLGYQTYGLPGGKLKKGEDIIVGAKREVKEETNLDIDNLVEIGWTNDIYPELNLHYVTLFYFTRTYNGQVINVEYPDKCLELKWIDYKKSPANLFFPLYKILKDKEKRLKELFEGN
jgi:8-oxo-dGTP diphosphatase